MVNLCDCQNKETPTTLPAQQKKKLNKTKCKCGRMDTKAPVWPPRHRGHEVAKPSVM